MQAAMQRAVVAFALAPAPAPEEGFKEQTEEDNNQLWAANST